MKTDIKNNNYIDITNEMLKKATPNSHKIKDLNYWIINGKKHYVDNKYIILNYSTSELKCAMWLEKTFGGKIYMCPKVNKPDCIKTPDFIFRGEYWDLKEIECYGKNTIDSILKKCKNQATNFIIDVSKSSTNINIFKKQIEDIYLKNIRYWLNIIILKNNNVLIKVYKKRN